MKDVTTEQNSQKVRETHNSYNEIDALQHFYKQIGIPAVAAAVLRKSRRLRLRCLVMMILLR